MPGLRVKGRQQSLPATEAFAPECRIHNGPAPLATCAGALIGTTAVSAADGSLAVPREHKLAVDTVCVKSAGGGIASSSVDPEVKRLEVAQHRVRFRRPQCDVGAAPEEHFRGVRQPTHTRAKDYSLTTVRSDADRSDYRRDSEARMTERRAPVSARAAHGL